MKRKGLAFYLANWYAFAVAGVLLSLQHPGGSWLASLPWATWGTELGQALAGGDAASGGAWWLLMGAVLAFAGVAGSVVASLSWLAAQGDPAQARRRQPPAQAPQAGDARAFSERAQEAADLVEDPRLRSLIQQLHTRLG